MGLMQVNNSDEESAILGNFVSRPSSHLIKVYMYNQMQKILYQIDYTVRPLPRSEKGKFVPASSFPFKIIQFSDLHPHLMDTSCALIRL